MDSVDYYNQHAAQYYDATVDLDMSQILERFQELLPEGAAVLDLGCGSGRDSLFLIEEGFDVTALDASEELCELAQIHIGQDVLCMHFEDMEFEEVFDGIWACASLLHVLENEIDSILTKVVNGLKPGGILYMSFRYGDGIREKDGRLSREYNTKMLKELMGRQKNMTVLDIFKSEDVREEQKEENWINILTRKLEKNE